MEEGKKNYDKNKVIERMQWDIEFLKCSIRDIERRISAWTFGMWAVIIILCFALGFLYARL